MAAGQQPSDALVSETSTAATTSMNTSAHSDATDTTVDAAPEAPGVTLATTPTLEELASLVVAGCGQDVPFREYTSETKSSLNESRSRHGSGNNEVRRGSFIFVPHPGHLLSRSSFSSDTNSVNKVGENYERQGSSDVFTAGCDDTLPLDPLEVDFAVSGERDVGCRDEPAASYDTADANYDANHSRVEGTLDLEISHDAMLLRQLSMELTRERETAVERRRYTDTLTVVVVLLAVCSLGALFVWRRR